MVQHGLTGLLVPARDTGALVEAMRRLVASPTLRLRMGAAAHAAAVARYGAEVVARQIAEHYEALLARAAGTGERRAPRHHGM